MLVVQDFGKRQEVLDWNNRSTGLWRPAGSTRLEQADVLVHEHVDGLVAKKVEVDDGADEAALRAALEKAFLEREGVERLMRFTRLMCVKEVNRRLGEVGEDADRRGRFRRFTPG